MRSCENFLCTVAHEGKDHELALWDTGGAEEYDRLRPLAYHKTSFFLLCFAVDDPESLEQIESHFLPEIQHYSPGVPIIIVGLRVDLRSDSQHQQRLLDRGVFPTTFTQGEHLAERVGVVRYMECSALTGHGVDAVFEAGVAAGVDYEKCWLARQKHMWWSKK
nr:Rho GTPase [Polyrhizophydium stewartii]